MSLDIRFSSRISRWVDAVASNTATVLPANNLDVHSDNNQINNHAATKKRSRSEDADSGIGVSSNDSAEPTTPTPRPLKRQRDADESHFSAAPTASRTSRYTPSNSSHSVSSITSRNSSPVKQLQTLADDVDCPVTFRDFDNVQAWETEEDGEVSRMQRILRRFADGIGILEYETDAAFQADIADIPISDQERMLYPSARRIDSPKMGVMPPMTDLSAIKHSAWELNTGGGGSEDEWNTEVHYPLLKLALHTSVYSKSLCLHSVKSAKVAPLSLARETPPKRVVDYVLCLKPNTTIETAFRSLKPLPGGVNKSWNHVLHTEGVRKNPIVINIETKNPMSSWAEGKPQIGIWTDAWLRRCELLWQEGRDTGARLSAWPVIPILIVQGHEWHLLIATKSDQGLLFREQIPIGSTRTCFDMLKIVAILHWLFQWAETTWRPWFLSLIDKKVD
ncbi:hypothetical protein ACEQ8H_008957 [Pleosporales sp. CAS-2024a]